jgi:hypothetical protein
MTRRRITRATIRSDNNKEFAMLIKMFVFLLIFIGTSLYWVIKEIYFFTLDYIEHRKTKIK